MIPRTSPKLDQNIDNGEYVVIAQSGVEAEIAINNVRTELVMNRTSAEMHLLHL